MKKKKKANCQQVYTVCCLWCKKEGEGRRGTCTNVNAHLPIFSEINVGKGNQKLMELAASVGGGEAVMTWKEWGKDCHFSLIFLHSFSEFYVFKQLNQ